MANFEVDGLRFINVPPADLAERFPEIQDFRLSNYSRLIDRPPEQIEHFVGRLTVEFWSDPNLAVGKVARSAQRRFNPRVVMALDDQTDEIAGYTYMAGNVSSKIEKLLRKLHTPDKIATYSGNRERKFKMERSMFYAWGNEYVTDGRAGLPTVLAAINIGNYPEFIRGTWFPWDEEEELKGNLNVWGYRREGEPEDLEGDKGFGEGSDPTHQEIWKSRTLATVRENILAIAGARTAIDQAKRSLGH